MASLFGLGQKSMAMGGTSLNQGVYNPYQVYSAPAALGFLRRVEFSMGAQYFSPNLKPFGSLVVSSAGTMGAFDESGVLGGGGSLLSFALPLGRVRPLVLAGAIYMPFSTLLRVSSAPVDFPFYPLYTDVSRNFFFLFGAGYEIADGWALGINVRSTTKSTVNYVLRTDNTVNYSASATEAKSESRLSYSIVYDNGRKTPERPWSAGFMYRAKSGMETKIMADVSAFVALKGELISLPAYTPSEFVLMGSGKIHSWTISGDVSRVRWSEYVSPYGSGNINSYAIGSRRGSADFHDITVFRLGLQQDVKVGARVVKKIAFREGYQYHPSAVPDQTGDTNFVDNHRHLFSVGTGFALQSPFRDDDTFDLDLFFQYNWLKSRPVRKNLATNVGAPGYETGGSILLYGMGVSMRF